MIITSQSFDLSMKYEKYDLPKLYWLPKLHKGPYKQPCITGASNCSTNHLSKLLTSILAAVKTGLQRYHDTNLSEVALIKYGY